MENQFSLLIADRNRNVRDFLRREFVAEGYSVQLVKDDRELLNMINGGASPDLLILDLEMPYGAGPEVLEQLRSRNPLIPVVIYTLLTDNAAHEAIQTAAAFLEKRGNNIEDLKTLVEEVLKKRYPQGPGIATQVRETAEEQSEEHGAIGSE